MISLVIAGAWVFIAYLVLWPAPHLERLGFLTEFISVCIVTRAWLTDHFLRDDVYSHRLRHLKRLSCLVLGEVELRVIVTGARLAIVLHISAFAAHSVGDTPADGSLVLVVAWTRQLSGSLANNVASLA
jgi:hypothetical protein